MFVWRGYLKKIKKKFLKIKKKKRDGGGIRGIIMAEMLKVIERITNRKMWYINRWFINIWIIIWIGKKKKKKKRSSNLNYLNYIVRII